MKKKIILFCLTFCLLFGSVLSVSAAETYTFGTYTYNLSIKTGGNLRDYAKENGGHLVIMGVHAFVSIYMLLVLVLFIISTILLLEIGFLIILSLLLILVLLMVIV